MHSAGARTPSRRSRNRVDGEEVHPEVEYSILKFRWATFFVCFFSVKPDKLRVPGSYQRVEKIDMNLAANLRREYRLPN